MKLAALMLSVGVNSDTGMSGPPIYEEQIPSLGANVPYGVPSRTYEQAPSTYQVRPGRTDLHDAAQPYAPPQPAPARKEWTVRGQYSSDLAPNDPSRYRPLPGLTRPAAAPATTLPPPSGLTAPATAYPPAATYPPAAAPSSPTPYATPTSPAAPASGYPAATPPAYPTAPPSAYPAAPASAYPAGPAYPATNNNRGTPPAGSYPGVEGYGAPFTPAVPPAASYPVPEGYGVPSAPAPAPAWPATTVPPQPYQPVAPGGAYEAAPMIPATPPVMPFDGIGPYGSPYNTPPGGTRPLDLDAILQETQTGRLMFGVGVNSDAGLVGSIIFDEQNFDWTRFPRSWEDIRNATAWRGAGQRFRIEAVPGTQVQRYMVNFQEPYLFDTRRQPGPERLLLQPHLTPSGPSSGSAAASAWATSSRPTSPAASPSAARRSTSAIRSTRRCPTCQEVPGDNWPCTASAAR